MKIFQAISLLIVGATLGVLVPYGIFSLRPSVSVIPQNERYGTIAFPSAGDWKIKEQKLTGKLYLWTAPFLEVPQPIGSPKAYETIRIVTPDGDQQKYESLLKGLSDKWVVATGHVGEHQRTKYIFVSKVELVEPGLTK